MKAVLVFASLLALCLATSDFDQWKDFKAKFGKAYGRSLEEQTRYKIFQNNLRRIETHNAKFEAGEVLWKMGVNQFADLTAAEFEAIYLIPVNKSDLIVPDRWFSPVGDDDVPDSFDWRDKGAVGPVKNQGTCGGCWTFSALGSLEGLQYINHGDLPDLSEQNLLDCADEDYSCHGCDGGVVQYAYDYIRDYGIMYAKDYEYTGVQSTCQYDDSKKAKDVFVYAYAGVQTEDDLKTAVATVGPISIAIHYDAELHQLYHSGIFSSKHCKGKVNHGVLVVGYGTEDGTDYWIVKNNYGTTYGEDGYFRMVRDKNMCNIMAQPCYPLIL